MKHIKSFCSSISLWWASWESRNLLKKVVFALTSGGTAFWIWIMIASEVLSEKEQCSHYSAVRDMWCDYHHLFPVALNLQRGYVRLPWLLVYGLNKKWGFKFCCPSMARIYMVCSCLWSTLTSTINTSIRLNIKQINKPYRVEGACISNHCNRHYLLWAIFSCPCSMPPYKHDN